MLADIISQITEPLDRKTLAEILYSLIQIEYMRPIVKTRTTPYNQLRALLNENYTMVHIRNLTDKTYTVPEIIGILIHLYNYSHIAAQISISCLRLQPHVLLNINDQHQYFFNYKTYEIYQNRNPKFLVMNDLKYIQEPVEFVEKPCTVNDVDSLHKNFIKDMEMLHSTDKCDQYMAFHIMIDTNRRKSPEVPPEPTNKGVKSRQSQQEETHPLKTLITKEYWSGYYMYNTPNSLYNYVFQKNK